MEDVTLTFDPSSFAKGFTAIEKGLGNLNTNFTKFSETSTKKLGQANLSAMNLVKVFAPLAMAYGMLKKTLSTIPEIGRTFSIVGDIMSKNLLWPLRKTLVPILQRLLKWVTANRTMFLRWGTVVVKVFKIITEVVKGVWKFIKGFWETLSGHLEHIFGRTTNKITDTVNLIIFKIATVIAFVSLALEPLGKLFGNVIGSLLKFSSNLFSGVIEGVGNLTPELKYLISLFKDLFDWMGKTNIESGMLGKSFKTLGLLIGTTLGVALRGIVSLIDHILTGLGVSINLVKMFFAYITKDKKAIEEARKNIVSKGERLKERSSSRSERHFQDISGFGSKTYDIFTDTKKKSKKPFEKSNDNGKTITPIQKDRGNDKLVNPETSLNSSTQINKPVYTKSSNISNATFNNKIDINIDNSKENIDVANNVSNTLRSLLKNQMVLAGGR